MKDKRDTGFDPSQQCDKPGSTFSINTYHLNMIRIWLPVIAGLLVLYLPTYVELAKFVWKQDEYAHGPIVLGIIMWLFWQKRKVFVEAPPDSWSASGAAFLLFGFLLYVTGRPLDILFFEVGSQFFVLCGIVLLLLGNQAFQKLWFPLLFLFFLIPLPGFIIDALTGPLKQQVSLIVEQLLYMLGYPIARSGVVLTIGSYQLLIADACSGLKSMYALTAMGVLFMYLRGRKSILHNGLLLLSILPIAFVINVMRVTALVLITYYLGDAAGQGFLHDFSGMAEFVIALLLLFFLDGLLLLMLGKREGVA